MRRTIALSAAALFALALLPASPLWANDNVELELLTTQGTPITAQHEWLAAMGNLEFASLRIRQARAGEAPSIEERAGGGYRVVGLITRQNQLRLPGATFRMTQQDAIREWMATVVAGGEQALNEDEAAFGLTASELLALYDQLAVPVAAETTDRNAGEVVRAIAGNLPVEVSYTAAARQALAGGEVVADELAGISSGTALAAAMRPLGLVFEPQKAEGTVGLRIATSTEVEENWPVGWPVEGSNRRAVPKLFEFLDVEIDDRPLTEVLDALQTRLDLPMVWDYNSLARGRIDLEQLRVTIPARNTFYQNVLNRALNQNRLKFEVRLDEAGEPLLWITTMSR